MSTQEDFNNRVAGEIVVLKAALAILYSRLPDDTREAILRGTMPPGGMVGSFGTEEARQEAYLEFLDKVREAHG